MRKLFKYDLVYLRKTQKFIVFGGIFVLFSILSPLTAKYIGEILGFFLPGEDLGSLFPDPTVLSAYEQYISDLYETIFFVVLFVSVSVFIRDKSKGLLVLIFSKPINRTQYLVSKYLSFLLLLASSILLGYLLFTYYTYFLFDEIFFWKGLAMMGLYFLYLAMMSSVALYFATIFKTYLLAVLSTFGVYIFISILSLFGEYGIFQYLPGMVIQRIVGVLYEVNTTGELVGTILVTIGITLAFLGLGVFNIQKMDAQ
jgi:ABC-2 type transport system permease protein